MEDDQQKTPFYTRRKYLQLFLTMHSFVTIFALSWFFSRGLPHHVDTYSSICLTITTVLLFLSFMFGIISALDCHHFLISLAIVSPLIIASNLIVLYHLKLGSWPHIVIGSFVGCVFVALIILLHFEIKSHENYLLLTPQDSVLIDSVVIYSRETNVAKIQNEPDLIGGNILAPDLLIN